MDHNIHALGMFMRFSPKESAVSGFLQQAVGLPLIRTVGAKAAEIYWAGEASVFEIIYVADKAAQPDGDPAHAPGYPVFRVNGLDALLARLKSKGATVVEAKPRGPGREAFIVDTDGFLIGLRERDAGSALVQDVEARRRRLRGETYNPGCKSMPEGLQELGWVVRRVEDMAVMAGFYGEVLGLEKIGQEDGHWLFDAGDNVILELAPGGRAGPPPAERYQAPMAALFRVGDIAKVRRDLVAGGAHVVNDCIPLHWADLMYFCDPEGGLLGAEQGFHPGQYAPEKFILAENLEAERRAREQAAAIRMGA